MVEITRAYVEKILISKFFSYELNVLKIKRQRRENWLKRTKEKRQEKAQQAFDKINVSSDEGEVIIRESLHHTITMKRINGAWKIIDVRQKRYYY